MLRREGYATTATTAGVDPQAPLGSPPPEPRQHRRRLALLRKPPPDLPQQIAEGHQGTELFSEYVWCSHKEMKSTRAPKL